MSLNDVTGVTFHTQGTPAVVNPLPAPVPTMVDPTLQETDAQKLKRLGILRLGFLSTLANGGQGLPGAGNVSTPSLLGGATAYAPGTKTLLGQ